VRLAASISLLVACGPQGAECTWLDAATSTSAGAGPDRIVPNTALKSCVNRLSGAERRIETTSSGAVVAEYGWRGDRPDGQVVVWSASGAFRWSETWEAGARTARRRVADDGALVELAITDNRVEELRVLPLGTEADEWEGRRRVRGARYRANGPSPAVGSPMAEE
jgi:hypothetical protein